MTKQPLAEFPTTQQPPGPGRIVHVKYAEPDGPPRTLPGMVVRAHLPPDGHPLVNVVPVGDGLDGVPFDGAGPALFDLPLFDPLSPGVVPDLTPQPADRPFAGRLLWAEWMPYQAAQHQRRQGEAETGVKTEAPRPAAPTVKVGKQS